MGVLHPMKLRFNPTAFPLPALAVSLAQPAVLTPAAIDPTQRLRRWLKALARWSAEACRRLARAVAAWPGERARPPLCAAAILLLGATLTMVASFYYLTQMHPASATFTEQWGFGFFLAVCSYVQCVASAFGMRGG